MHIFNIKDYNLKEPISITAISSISALGGEDDEIWNAYQKNNSLLGKKLFEVDSVWLGTLTNETRGKIEALKEKDPKYENLDKSVLYALLVSRVAISQAEWTSGDLFGVNIGSSRGATELFEKCHKEFIEQNSLPILTSPTTTLGNISSWVAHDLRTKGPDISHSITCSTGLHAVLNGIAWLQSGMADKFLVGGSEAPLTPFTIAQMKALKIYSRGVEPYPCRAMDFGKKQNSMVLGEGAAVCCLEKGIAQNNLALITGIGYATEPLEHNISISTNALCFQRSMQMAIGNSAPKDIDVVVMHAPGTIKGDLAERNAIDKIFGAHQPALTTNKWKIGHTFGASGMLSLEMAVLMLQKQEFLRVPYVSYNTIPKKIRKILVNAVGFGGNAVSILLKSVN